MAFSIWLYTIGNYKIRRIKDTEPNNLPTHFMSCNLIAIKNNLKSIIKNIALLKKVQEYKGENIYKFNKYQIPRNTDMDETELKDLKNFLKKIEQSMKEQGKDNYKFNKEQELNRIMYKNNWYNKFMEIIG